MIQDMINSENSMNTTESTNTNIFKMKAKIQVGLVLRIIQNP